MTHILLYWSHICVLHNGEKQFLKRLAEKLLGRDIQLEIRYFGLGYPEHMCEYLAKTDAQLPDIIVSADLEVFEDHRIFDKLRGSLYPVMEWFPVQGGKALETVQRGPELLPFTAIPLVYYTREPTRCENTALAGFTGLAFGGINNSAAKTIVKSVWNRWGKETAEKFLSAGRVSDMPIGAFQTVRQGLAQTALVPSLYALRADGRETFLRIPTEGPVLIPSYICARTSVPGDIARLLVQELICPELCDFYASQGDLIVFPATTQIKSRQLSERNLCPSAEWLKTFSPEEFYEVYAGRLPTCRPPL